MSRAKPSSSVTRRQLLKRTSAGAAAIGLASSVTFGAPAVVRAQTQIRMITPAALGIERELYQSFIDDFQAANPEITVELSFEAWGDYMTRLPTLFAGGAVPDVAHQHMSIVQDYGSRGALEDLTPYIEGDDVDPADYIEALIQAFSNTEGKLLAFPKDSAAWGIYYNKDKFDEAGVDYPSYDWTFEDFREIVRALTIDENGRRGNEDGFTPSDNMQQWGMSWVAPGPTASENVRGFVRGLGGDWYNEEMTETLITEDPMIEHFQMFHDMRCVERSVSSEALATGQGDPFRQGLTAMAVGFHNMDYFLREENIEFEWGITFIPSGPGGQFVPVGASGWAIPQGAENKDAAWQLIKHLVSPEVQASIGEIGRWGVSYKGAIATIVPEDGAEGFAEVHVEPLTGEGDRTPIGFRFPVNQSEIQQVYATHFDPVWACETDDIQGAAEAAKEEIDEILSDS
jgi:multiple sugar transport system substrate-binding protein